MVVLPSIVIHTASFHLTFFACSSYIHLSQHPHEEQPHLCRTPTRLTNTLISRWQRRPRSMWRVVHRSHTCPARHCPLSHASNLCSNAVIPAWKSTRWALRPMCRTLTWAWHNHPRCRLRCRSIPQPTIQPLLRLHSRCLPTSPMTCKHQVSTTFQKCSLILTLATCYSSIIRKVYRSLLSIILTRWLFLLTLCYLI